MKTTRRPIYVIKTFVARMSFLRLLLCSKDKVNVLAREIALWVEVMLQVVIPDQPDCPGVVTKKTANKTLRFDRRQ